MMVLGLTSLAVWLPAKYSRFLPVVQWPRITHAFGDA